MSSAMLVGRTAETGMLEGILDRIQERGSALVVRGDAGIGKTSLLAAATRQARERGVIVLSTAGVQSEADLAFSGLHQLLLPILSALEDLPAPQRDAVSAAFGLTAAPVPDLFLIALGALSLLAGAAERAPLLIVVDDAHWIDRPTAEVLAFVARRLESEPIAVLFALRKGFASALDVAGLPEMRVEAIGDDAAAELLDARPTKLPAELKRRVIRMAEGNPLALVELPGVLEADPSPGMADLGATPHLTTRLERAFADQGSGLPPATRTLLRVAAADEQLMLGELLAAASLIVGAEVTADHLGPAVTAGLVAVDDGRLRFRHPLVRSALLQSAGVSERQAAHAALAVVLSAQPDRQVWHRAASCAGPDEAVASELEELATRLTRQGAVSVAITALERAGRLSADSARRCARLLRAAELAFEIGERDLVERLVLEAEQLGPDAQQRARMTWIREIFTDGVPGDPVRVRALVDAAEESSSLGDTDLALSLLLGAALRCWWADPGDQVRDLVVRAAEGTDAGRTDPRLVAILAVAAPVECGATVIDRLAAADPASVADPLAAFLLGMAAHAVGHYERASQMFDSAIPPLRAQGRLALLAQVLIMRAWGAIPLGDWSSARSLAAEGERLARETAQPIWTAGAQIARALLAGLRGDREVAERLLSEAEEITVPRRLGDLLCVGALARAGAALAAGRFDDAFAQLRRIFDPSDPAFHMADRFMGIGALADAAVQCGNQAVATTILGELEALATLTPSPALRFGILYARPILANDNDAERLYLDALASELGAWPFLRARLQLGYGAWLRRRRRIAESRAPLRAARDTFDALGTPRWAERARQELRASGERSRRRVPDTRDELTPQELQIARLAAAGLSNRDIGQQLYLSPRTVASHLYRVFPKLGVTSRSQLASALRPEPESSVAS